DSRCLEASTHSSLQVASAGRNLITVFSAVNNPGEKKSSPGRRGTAAASPPRRAQPGASCALADASRTSRTNMHCKKTPCFKHSARNTRKHGGTRVCRTTDLRAWFARVVAASSGTPHAGFTRGCALARCSSPERPICANFPPGGGNENRPREAAGRDMHACRATSVVVVLDQAGVRVGVEHLVDLRRVVGLHHEQPAVAVGVL